MFSKVFLLVLQLQCTRLDSFNLTDNQVICDSHPYQENFNQGRLATNYVSSFEQEGNEYVTSDQHKSVMEDPGLFQQQNNQSTDKHQFPRINYQDLHSTTDMTQYLNNQVVPSEYLANTDYTNLQSIFNSSNPLTTYCNNLATHNIFTLAPLEETATDLFEKTYNYNESCQKRRITDNQSRISFNSSVYDSTDNTTQPNSLDYNVNGVDLLPPLSTFDNQTSKELISKATKKKRQDFSAGTSNYFNNLIPSNSEDTLQQNTSQLLQRFEVNKTQQVESNNQIGLPCFDDLISKTKYGTKLKKLAESNTPKNNLPVFHDIVTDLEFNITDLNGYSFGFLKRFKDVISLLEIDFSFSMFSFSDILCSCSHSEFLYSNDFKIIQGGSLNLFDLSSIQNTFRVTAMSSTADFLIQFLNNLNIGFESQIVLKLWQAFDFNDINSIIFLQPQNYLSQIESKAKDEIYNFLNSDESCWLKSCAPGFYSFASNISNVQLNPKGDFLRSFLCFLLILKRNHILLPQMVENIQTRIAVLQKDLVFRKSIENNLPFFYVFLYFLPLSQGKEIILENFKGALWSTIYINEMILDTEENITNGRRSRFLVLNTLFYHINLSAVQYIQYEALNRPFLFTRFGDGKYLKPELNELFAAAKREISLRFEEYKTIKHLKYFKNLESNFKMYNSTLITLDKLLYCLNTIFYYQIEQTSKLRNFYNHNMYKSKCRNLSKKKK